jgi:hypothetical protein
MESEFDSVAETPDEEGKLPPNNFSITVTQDAETKTSIADAATEVVSAVKDLDISPPPAHTISRIINKHSLQQQQQQQQQQQHQQQHQQHSLYNSPRPFTVPATLLAPDTTSNNFALTESHSCALNGTWVEDCLMCCV